MEKSGYVDLWVGEPQQLLAEEVDGEYRVGYFLAGLDEVAEGENLSEPFYKYRMEKSCLEDAIRNIAVEYQEE